MVPVDDQSTNPALDLHDTIGTKERQGIPGAMCEMFRHRFGYDAIEIVARQPLEDCRFGCLALCDY